MGILRSERKIWLIRFTNKFLVRYEVWVLNSLVLSYLLTSEDLNEGVIDSIPGRSTFLMFDAHCVRPDLESRLLTSSTRPDKYSRQTLVLVTGLFENYCILFVFENQQVSVADIPHHIIVCCIIAIVVSLRFVTTVTLNFLRSKKTCLISDTSFKCTHVHLFSLAGDQNLSGQLIKST